MIALADPAARIANTEPQLIVAVLNRACHYLIWAEGGARGFALAQSTVTAAENSLGADHPETLTARYREAFTLRQTGRKAQAITRFESLMADQERVLGREHPDTLSTRGSLAVAYRAAGRVEEAIAIYEPLLADRERVLGPAFR